LAQRALQQKQLGLDGNETLQSRVGSLLRRLCSAQQQQQQQQQEEDGTAWFVTEDAVLANGYSVDFLLHHKHPTSAGGLRAAQQTSRLPLMLAVEVDGPSHFLQASTIPRGETLMKHRHLRALGLRVVSIPYWEWAPLEAEPVLSHPCMQFHTMHYMVISG